MVHNQNGNATTHTRDGCMEPNIIGRQDTGQIWMMDDVMDEYKYICMVDPKRERVSGWVGTEHEKGRWTNVDTCAEVGVPERDVGKPRQARPRNGSETQEVKPTQGQVCFFFLFF